MSIRKPPDWLGQADERLLEILDTSGPKSPHVIEESEYISYSRTHINQRLLLLKDVHLVQMIGNGVYQITPKGRSFLTGDADLREEEKPE